MMKPWKIGRKERLGLLELGPKIWEAYNGLECQHRIPGDAHRDVKEAIAIARKFNREVIQPIALDTDLKCMRDHDYLPREFVKKAAEWGLFTLFIPKLFHGKGLSFLACYPFMEELSSACAGLGHVVAVHYCGAATLFPSMNARVLHRVFRDVAKSERAGDPHLMTIVVTEPESGTDVQEPLLVNHAKPGSTVKKVDGGYVINGKKIFISNGHLSYWHIANFIEDKTNKSESWVQFAVPNGMPGFSFGTREKKMGQFACCASELLFDDCFVPDDLVSIRSQDPKIKNSKKGPRWVCHTIVDHVTASTRTGTAAISTGIGRDAYERALEYARTKRIAGELLINHQWAQIILTEMYRNVIMSRVFYMESAFALTLSGLFKLLFMKPVYRFLKLMPRWYFRLVSPLLNLEAATWFLRKFYYDWYPTEERNVASGWGSACKFTCSDIGLANANLALDLMGADGLRHENGAEKCFRDVKLQQIYESTNQINQMNMFYCLVANDMPEVEFFK
jgi:alkylation response protein AidB-like acyl-CoA dehydrogenase